MSNSNRTTKFGPRVSFTTTKSDAGPVHVEIPSDGTLEVAAETGIKMSGATSASMTSLLLPDGHLSIGSVSVTSATIYYRSGNTIYEFDAQASGVL